MRSNGRVRLTVPFALRPASAHADTAPAAAAATAARSNVRLVSIPTIRDRLNSAGPANRTAQPRRYGRRETGVSMNDPQASDTVDKEIALRDAIDGLRRLIELTVTAEPSHEELATAAHHIAQAA